VETEISLIDYNQWQIIAYSILNSHWHTYSVL